MTCCFLAQPAFATGDRVGSQCTPFCLSFSFSSPSPFPQVKLACDSIWIDDPDLEALARLMLVAIVSPGRNPQKFRRLPVAAWSPPSARPPARLPARLPALPCCSPSRPQPLCPLHGQVSAVIPGSCKLRAGLKVMRAIQRPLFESAASLDRQLAALGQRCSGGSSGGAGSNLPTAAQLQVAWAALLIMLERAGAPQALPQAEIVAFREQAARQLLALQPDSPRRSFELGGALVAKARTDTDPCLHVALRHFRRGAELARAQGSDFWLARWAGARASCSL